jgi:hypothetical protein
MWGIARVVLGLSSDEFWKLTFAQWHALNKAYLYDLDNKDLATAINSKLITDVNRDKNSEPIPLTEFLPDRMGRFRDKKSSEATSPAKQFQADLRSRIESHNRAVREQRRQSNG